MGLMKPADLIEWVERSCAAQGVAAKVTDANAITKVRVLLMGRDGPEGRRDPSQTPAGKNALGIEMVNAGRSGADNDVVKDCGDDGVLPGEIQTGPPGAEDDPLACQTSEGAALRCTG
jgi:hypothetical protein